MLFLEGQMEWHTEPITKTRFEIKPMTADEYVRILNSCRLQDGSIDMVAKAVKMNAVILNGWDGIGDKKGGVALPCSAENVERFAKAHCMGLASWTIDVARSIARFMDEETVEAKKD